MSLIPATILTGFLGSGKTTLLNRNHGSAGRSLTWCQAPSLSLEQYRWSSYRARARHSAPVISDAE